jgi:O-acetyl-ADP-ribose deacetylase (regulator of RNase III)
MGGAYCFSNLTMTIKFVQGDLFKNRFNAQSLAHGCNCKGSMGAGIAVEFKNRYPQMYEEYRKRCKATPREFNPGEIFLWKCDAKPWVFNLATQEDYWRSRATYQAIEEVLKKMKQRADDEGITTIAMPRIGAGYGGLSWKKVRLIIEQIFADWSGELVVYEEYQPEK